MKPYFADSWYFLALLNDEDESHLEVREFTASMRRRVITCDWILAEVGDAISSPRLRTRFPPFYESLRSSKRITVLGATRAQILVGTQLYSERPDKAWSLTDCIAFSIMEKRRLSDVLTADRHFEQAGFRALFAR